LNVWDLVILQPMINSLITMSHYLLDNFGLAIIVLTIIVNVAMMPLTMKQIKSTKAMQEMQPKLAELQKKYGKDRQRMAQEQMRLYKESGMNPVGCIVPMLIQMPIWISLYQSIMLSLAVAPEGLLNLSQYLYSWPVVFTALPLSRDFLMLDLAEPNLILAILVGATMWLQQKMATPTTTDARQKAQTKMMLWMMPMMFTFLATTFPSGLALFWVASSVARIVIQYYITGWGGLTPATVGRTPVRDKKYMRYITRAEEKSVDDVGADIVVDAGTEQQTRDRGLGYPTAPDKTRYQPGKDRSHRRKK